MKVALIIEWLDGWRGGAETSTQQFIHELADLGVALEVFTRSHVPSRPGVTVNSLRVAGPSRALRTLSFTRRADEAAARCQADVIHAISPSRAAQVYQPRGGTYAETLARNRALRHTPAGRIVKRLMQHVNVRQRLMLKLEQAMLTRPDPPLVLALSDYVVRQLHDHYQLGDEHIRKVFNGVAADDSPEEQREANRREIRAMYGVTPEEMLAITVAHNFRLKGVGTLIDALSHLRGRGQTAGLRVLVIGKGHGISWESRIRRRGLGEVIRFIGPTQRIRAFYHAADLLVHPTFYDPCSRVVLEAQASGLPCITTRYDGAAERIADGVTGYILEEASDARALADRLMQLLDGRVREGMRQAVRETSPAEMRRHAQEVIAAYESLAGGQGSR